MEAKQREKKEVERFPELSASVRKFGTRLGWNPSRLARACDVSQPAAQRWWNGEAADTNRAPGPSMAHMFRIERVMGLERGELFIDAFVPQAYLLSLYIDKMMNLGSSDSHMVAEDLSDLIERLIAKHPAIDDEFKVMATGAIRFAIELSASKRAGQPQPSAQPSNPKLDLRQVS